MATPAASLGTRTGASSVMVAYRLLSSVMLSNDDSNWSVHSMMFSFHDLHGCVLKIAITQSLGDNIILWHWQGMGKAPFSQLDLTVCKAPSMERSRLSFGSIVATLFLFHFSFLVSVFGGARRQLG